MKRAAISARVSTDGQAEHGYSLPTQLEGCRRYAAEHGFSIVTELVDDCSGSIPIADRPEGRKLYDLVSSKAVDAVILYTHDRTARDEQVLEYLLFKAFCYDHGVELHYSDAGLDPYTMEGNLVGYIKAHAAAEERKKIRERSTRGKNGKAQNGRIVFGGTIPYAYRKQGKGREAIYIIYEPEAETVRLIYAWYVDGVSVYEIVDRLRENSAPPPKLGRWTKDSVTFVLNNELYAGVFWWGQVRVINGKKVKQPRESWTRIDVPELAIVDRPLWEAAGERKRQNKERARRNTKHEYLLSGHFSCTFCGGAMVGTAGIAHGVLFRRYRCSRYWHRDERQNCPNTDHGVGAVLVEGKAWEWLVDLLTDDEKLRKGIGAMKSAAELEIEPKRARLSTVLGLAETAERKVKRLAAEIGNYEDTPENEIIRESLRAEMKLAAKQKTSFEEEKKRLEGELQQVEVTPQVESDILAIAGQVRGKLSRATFPHKREIFDYFNVRVSFRRDAVREYSDGRRWLDISCKIRPEADVIALDTHLHPPQPG